MKTLYIFSIILSIYCVAFAERALISVSGLEKVNAQKYSVIERVGDVTIMFADNKDIESLQKNRYTITTVDKSPTRDDGRYFIVYPMFVKYETIAQHCTVLAHYDHFMIVKIGKSQEDVFLSLKTEKNELEFTPYTFESNVANVIKTVYPYNNGIQDAVNEISKDSLRSYVSKLENFPSRHSSMNEAAVQWIVEKFTSFGVDSVFTQNVPNYGKNIIAIIKGEEHVEKQYCFMGGHMDAVNKSGVKAAGADDNASGTASTLEVARVLANKKLRHTIRLICYNGEESGLQGSAVYARDAKNNGHKVIGAGINIDMGGYSKTPETRTCWIHYDKNIANNLEGAELFKQCANDYVGFTNVQLTSQSGIMGASDQASFWKNGYPCIFGIETKERGGLCPNYHAPGDLLDDPGGLNDSELMTIFAKTSLAILANYGELLVTPIKSTSLLSNKNTISMSSNKGIAQVSFNLVNADFVTLTAYNSRGVKLGNIVNKTLKAGNHTVQWQPKSKGFYIVRMTVKGGQTLEKTLFVK